MGFEVILRSENPKGIPFSKWRSSAGVPTKTGMSVPQLWPVAVRKELRQRDEG